MNPTQLFLNWYHEEMALSRVRIPSACCLSTIGLDGFPNSRFVSLKEVIEGNFIITGPLSSRKGLEIEHSDKVALSFWWVETERQVRIQGIASKINEELADRYFAERNREGQIISSVSNQGDEILNLDLLIMEFEKARLKFGNMAIKRPDNWGGYSINPIRIEFLEFHPSRFHDRRLFENINGNWNVKQLQP